ncbi:tetratricopeptide repeat-containing sensor histidine kinase [Ekhidna sp.]|uniref:tetratricopeptide repeat-containing sensor histidine kinase n=1 Tax=Ekhidna sp. TaxID=2608089 RepID=UPI003C7C6DFF
MKLTIHLFTCYVLCFTSTGWAQRINYSKEVDRLIRQCDSLVYDQPQESLELAQTAHNLAKDSENDSLIAVALNRVGSAHWSLGNPMEALEQLQASLQISELNDFEEVIAKNLGNIGNVYAASGLDLDAIGYYRSELAIQEKLNDTFRLFAVNNNIGKAFLDLSYYDSANHYLMKAFDYLDPQFEHLHSIYFFNQAELNYKQGNLQKADSLVQLTMANAQEFNSKRGIIRANQLQAELDRSRGKYQSALIKAKDAFSMALESGVKELIYITSKTLSRCYGAVNQFEDAYEMELLHEQYLDSVQSVNTINELELLSYYQRLFQVRVLESKNKLNKQLADQRQLIIQGLVVALVIAAILIAIIVMVVRELGIRKRKLEDLNKFKAKIFAIVSHDLKSPIQSVSSVIEMFNQKLIGKEEIEPLLPEVKEKTSNLINLLNNIFLWAEGQMEGENLAKENFSLHPVIEELESELKERLEGKQIELQYEAAFGFYLHSNPGIIRVLLRNLVVNAIKFSNPNSRVEINCIKGESTKVIEVIDDGVGMSKEKQEKLFTGGLESSDGTAGERGNGLGLALCHDFVRGLGGKIEVESVKEEGSVFRIIFNHQNE